MKSLLRRFWLWRHGIRRYEWWIRDPAGRVIEHGTGDAIPGLIDLGALNPLLDVEIVDSRHGRIRSR